MTRALKEAQRKLDDARNQWWLARESLRDQGLKTFILWSKTNFPEVTQVQVDVQESPEEGTQAHIKTAFPLSGREEQAYLDAASDDMYGALECAFLENGGAWEIDIYEGYCRGV